jgi:hypothetical protein
MTPQIIAQLNSPRTVFSSGVTVSAVMLAMPSGLGPALSPDVLTFNDAASLASANSGNALGGIPLSAMSVGMVIPLGTTSTGLTASSVPPGVGVGILQ